MALVLESLATEGVSISELRSRLSRYVMLRDRLPVLRDGDTMRQAIVMIAERRGIAVIVDGYIEDAGLGERVRQRSVEMNAILEIRSLSGAGAVKVIGARKECHCTRQFP